MLLASGWSGPAKISFASDLTGNDPNSGSSRFWVIAVKWSVVKRRNTAILSTPRHDQGPCNTGLGFKITVGWETVSAVVIDLIKAIFGGILLPIFDAGCRTESALEETKQATMHFVYNSLH